MPPAVQLFTYVVKVASAPIWVSVLSLWNSRLNSETAEPVTTAFEDGEAAEAADDCVAAEPANNAR